MLLALHCLYGPVFFSCRFRLQANRLLCFLVRNQAAVRSSPSVGVRVTCSGQKLASCITWWCPALTKCCFALYLNFHLDRKLSSCFCVCPRQTLAIQRSIITSCWCSRYARLWLSSELSICLVWLEVNERFFQ